MSPTHQDGRLRCPNCLRQFINATALVQHAEAQAIKCQIRDTTAYRQALDQITAGLVDTAGRHSDDTIKYIAKKTAGFRLGMEEEPISLAQNEAMKYSKMTVAHDQYWKEREARREKLKEEMAQNQKW